MVEKRGIHNWRIIFCRNNKKDLIIRQIPDVNGAILVLNPHSGDIAMTGGFSFNLSQFNRSTQAKDSLVHLLLCLYYSFK